MEKYKVHPRWFHITGLATMMMITVAVFVTIW